MSNLIDSQVAIDAICDNCDTVKASCPHYPCSRYVAVEKLPSAQPEQSDTSEFWRKRADYYSDMCMNLIGEMGKGVKIESVKISENGIEFIKKLPSAQPEQRWIPVSERLPTPLEWDEKYLVSLAWGGIGVMEYKSTGFHNYGSFNPVPIETVTAWMPLPEPYKEGREE